MARIRTLKPEFWQNKKLAQSSPESRLLAIALLQLCDRNGVFLNIPMQIHGHAFPWEETVKTPSLLGELEAAGYLQLYSVGGKDYGFIPGFTKHQTLGGKEASSEGRYPLPNQADSTEEVQGKEKGSTQTLPGEVKGNAGTGNKEQGIRKGGASALAKPDYLQADVWDDFIAFRKQTKFPLTPSAWKSIDRELRAGIDKLHDPNVMLAEAMAAGWRGFRLDWYENRIRTNAPRGGLGVLE